MPPFHKLPAMSSCHVRSSRPRSQDSGETDAIAKTTLSLSYLMNASNVILTMQTQWREGKKDTGYQFRRWIELNSFHYLTKSSFKYWYWNQGWGVVWLISWCILKSYISSIYIFMCQAQRKTFFEIRFYNSTWETICPFVLCCRVLWKGGITSTAVLMLRAKLCDGCNSVVLQKQTLTEKKSGDRLGDRTTTCLLTNVVLSPCVLQRCIRFTHVTMSFLWTVLPARIRPSTAEVPNAVLSFE